MISPDTSTSIEVAVTATHAEFAAAMTAGQFWQFTSNTNCWVKQASPTGLITCVANASMADSDFMTINDGINAAVLYEYDKAGDGVTGGRTAWAVGTTALTVATNLAAAIRVAQPYITVIDNHDGTLSLSSVTRNITLTENVANAGFTATYGPIATAATGSMFVAAGVSVYFDGRLGSDVSVLRDTADGKATLTHVFLY